MSPRHHVAPGERAPQARRSRAKEAAPVQLLEPAAGTGELIAVSRSRPGAYYRLSAGPDGRWACTCDGFAHRGDCAHVKAASDLTRQHCRAERIA